MANETKPRILLAGATGYVGGRLANLLVKNEYPVRCMARRPKEAKLRLPETTEIVAGDVLESSTLPPLVEGIHTAYYLIHSMGDAEDFEKMDRLGAENFADACETAGVQRIIYLGGLGNEDKKLSAHLRSRHEVGSLLRRPNVEVIEFRASIVIGSGSLSFEMVRSLTEKLPVMLTPKWVQVKAQPIGIEDLLQYLIAPLSEPVQESRIIEIGGKDVVSYYEIMQEYARQRGLKRFFINVPFLTPRLSSLWLGFVTPLYARVGHKLITSIKNRTVVRNPEAARKYAVQPVGIKGAIRRALSREDQEFGNTHWADALSSLGNPKSWAGVNFGNRIVDNREVQIDEPLESVFHRVKVVGGRTGWYFANVLWRVRGFIDKLVGGPGLRRGRRHPEDIRVGDAIDFWRVEAFEENRKLRLRAEMKVPGRAWLEFSVERQNDKTTLRQTAIFDPVGLAGRFYWYLLYPLHAIIFRGMLRRMANV